MGQVVVLTVLLMGEDTFMRFGRLLYFIEVFEIAQKLLGNVQGHSFRRGDMLRKRSSYFNEVFLVRYGWSSVILYFTITKIKKISVSQIFNTAAWKCVSPVVTDT